MAYNSESWPNVLERLLKEQAPRADGRRYEVLNAGVITYQPIHDYLWWRLYGRQLQPDLLISGYYVGNDLVDALVAQTYRVCVFRLSLRLRSGHGSGQVFDNLAQGRRRMTNRRLQTTDHVPQATTHGPSSIGMEVL